MRNRWVGHARGDKNSKRSPAERGRGDMPLGASHDAAPQKPGRECLAPWAALEERVRRHDERIIT